VFNQLIHADEVSKKEICNEERYQEKRNELNASFPDLFAIPGHCPQQFLFGRIAIDPIFNFPEYHFHKNGLRAGPSAEYPAKYHGKQNHKHHESEHGNTKNKKVLWPEDQPKDDEFSFQEIQHQQRGIVYFYEWQRKKNGEIKNTEPGTQVKQPAPGLFGINEITFTITGYSSYRIPVRSLPVFLSYIGYGIHCSFFITFSLPVWRWRLNQL